MCFRQTAESYGMPSLREGICVVFLEAIELAASAVFMIMDGLLVLAAQGDGQL
jgi:hypothetical protein